MRVVLIALHFAEYAARLALALALSDEHEVLLILRADNANNELSPRLYDDLTRKVQVHCVEHRMLKQPSVAGAALRIVRRVVTFHPDAVHAQEQMTDYGCWALLWLMRRYPTVLTVHDHVSHSGVDSKIPMRKKFYLKQIRKRAQHIIVHGECIRQELVATRIRDLASVSSIMHGVLGVDKLCADTGYPLGSPSLLFFGRVEAYKGLGVLLDALDLLRSESSLAVRLVVAGRGSDLDQYRARIAADKNVELLDRYIAPEEISDLFARNTVVVLPYIDATQSGVAALAFACGRPVIASATGALPEVVRDGETGLLVPPNDAAALANAIHRLLTDRALWKLLADGAHALATGDLSWPSIADKTTNAYLATVAFQR
ncbi:MAG TPA: glycosyltransferase family 4 protein [Rhodocyclaceae bacterium]|nr:glycosyltransferase family 4 protein [Rhodocyclaceae bacterium]